MSYPSTVKGCEDYITELVTAAGDDEVCISIRTKAMMKARNALLHRGVIEVTHHDAEIAVSYIKRVVGPPKLQLHQVRRLFAERYAKMATSRGFVEKGTSKRDEWYYFILLLIGEGKLPESAINWKCPRSIRNLVYRGES